MKIERTFYSEHRQLLQMTEQLLGKHNAQKIMHTKAAERFRLTREIVGKTRPHRQDIITLEEFNFLAYHAFRVADELNKDLLIDVQDGIGTISLIGPQIIVDEMADEFIIKVLDEILAASRFRSQTIERYGESLTALVFTFAVLN